MIVVNWYFKFDSMLPKKPTEGKLINLGLTPPDL